MAFVVPNAGETTVLNGMNGATWKIILFTNNVTPSETTVVGDLTEATASGYSAIELTSNTGTVATDGSDNTSLEFPQQTFSFTAAETVYGYATLVDFAGGTSYDLFSVETFSDGPYNIPSGGGSIKVTAKITLD